MLIIGSHDDQINQLNALIKEARTKLHTLRRKKDASSVPQRELDNINLRINRVQGRLEGLHEALDIAKAFYQQSDKE